MKKSFCVLLFLLACTPTIFAQTEGTLTVTATTSSAGGNYAPKNIVAVWIEDEQGHWVKTLLAYAATRKTHLNTWEAVTTAAGSPFNTVDAITGATKTSHGTRTCTWNGTDVNGALVPDGNYKVWMELTDKNGTGNFSSFGFTKDTLPQNLTPANVPSFSSISIAWEPVIVTSVNENHLNGLYTVYPNPNTGIFRVEGEGIIRVEILDAEGRIVFAGNSQAIDISARPKGIYYVRITSHMGEIIKKVMKND